MTIWIRNVEKVVEDARANFAAGSMTPLPPLPPRIAHSSRRGLKVDQIFRDDTAVANAGAERSPASRQRRATLLSRSPEPPARESLEQSRDCPSPAGTKETGNVKVQTAFDLSQPISPPTKLQRDVERNGEYLSCSTLGA